MRGPRRFPWSGREVPHAILDVGRGCDCRCRACYNGRRSGFHDLERLKHDLKTLCRLRRLHTITLAGGEPLLHPHLPDIIRLVKQVVPRCALLTNGIRLDDSLAKGLTRAGLDAVFLHIDAGQERGDLPKGHTARDRNNLRVLLARRCRAQGLEVGLEVTIYRGGETELRDAIQTVTNDPSLRYLLVTLCSDLGAWKNLKGSVDQGFTAQHHPSRLAQEVLSLSQIMPTLLSEGLVPLSYLGSSTRGQGPRWLGFGRAIRHQADGGRKQRELRPTLLSDWLPRLGRLLDGRYPFFLPRSRWRSTFLSAFVSGSGGEVLDKWFVIQEGPRSDGHGGVIHCAHCPDAVTLGGHLVPVCLSDAWTPS